jgi:hypothetical protein
MFAGGAPVQAAATGRVLERFVPSLQERSAVASVNHPPTILKRCGTDAGGRGHHHEIVQASRGCGATTKP